ncbi:MAG TPA: DUF4136 domain-containing protein [Bryobacteraceae bacterium]|nr:DUF4136 domain-containing protein [Bryobacteraceae bacterium]
MKHLIAPAMLAVLTIGLLVADVKTDYSHSADFRDLHTYSWLKVDAANPLWTDRIQRAVDQELAAKGLTKQPNDGDIRVAAIGRTKESQTYTTFYNDLGGGWMWQGFGDGISTTTSEETPVGTLTVDLFNGKTKKLIWRGVATKTLSDKPEKNEKKLQDAVAKMFDKFPPKND